MFVTCKCCKRTTEVELDSREAGRVAFTASGICDHCGVTISQDLDINKNPVKDFTICPSPIVSVEVTLDQDVPEYMEGVLRIGTVQIIRQNGDREDRDKLVDNGEFGKEEAIRQFVAKELNVSINLVKIIPSYE